jgi:hypothetical protein
VKRGCAGHDAILGWLNDTLDGVVKRVRTYSVAPRCKRNGLFCALETSLFVARESQVEETAEPAGDFCDVGSGLARSEVYDLIEYRQHFYTLRQRVPWVSNDVYLLFWYFSSTHACTIHVWMTSTISASVS